MARKQADREIGAGTLEVDRVEPPLAQPLGRGDDRAHPLAPRLRRIVRFEPADVDDLVPELVERRLGIEFRVDALGPARVRTGAGRPVRGARVHDLGHLLHVREKIAAHPGRIDPVEDRRVAAGERDPGRVLIREPAHPLADPGRDELERVLRGKLEPRPLDELVEPEDVDPAGAATIGRAGDRANSVGHLVVGRDPEDLTWLEIRAEPDEQVGEALEVAAAILHRAADYRLCG